MAFWGVSLNPFEPYTLPVPIRVRITQATLGASIRTSRAMSVVHCSVGDKPAIALCSLAARGISCRKLHLEFQGSHDVVFTVKGPCGIHLAGIIIPPPPPPPPPAPHHSLEQENPTPDIAAGSTHHDLHKDHETDSNKTGIEHSGNNIKGGRIQLLKCSTENNIIEGNIKTTVDQKTSVNDGDQVIIEKTNSGLLEKESGGATEGQNKKKRKRNRKRRPCTSEATTIDNVQI